MWADGRTPDGWPQAARPLLRSGRTRVRCQAPFARYISVAFPFLRKMLSLWWVLQKVGHSGKTDDTALTPLLTLVGLARTHAERGGHTERQAGSLFTFRFTAGGGFREENVLVGLMLLEG